MKNKFKKIYKDNKIEHRSWCMHDMVINRMREN